MRFFLQIFLSLFFGVCIFQAQTSRSIAMVQYTETVSQGTSISTIYLGSLFVEGGLTYYKSEYKGVKESEGNANNDIISVQTPKSNFVSEIFANKKTNELVENKDDRRFLKKSYSVQESIPLLKWEILPGERIFNGMVCKNAITSFRGRKYTVWFTEEIAVTAGPWKLNGLPGLILYAQDSEGMYKWQLSNLQIPYKGNKLDMKGLFEGRFRYTKIRYQDYDAKFVEAIQDKIEIVKARSGSNGAKFGFSFSTHYEKEPINEWRTTSYFK